MAARTCLSLLLWVTLAAAGTIPVCSSVTFTISATAQNPTYAVSPDPNNETSIVNFVHGVLAGSAPPVSGTQAISGTFNINRMYCRPAITGPEDVLEILVHGNTLKGADVKK